MTVNHGQKTDEGITSSADLTHPKGLMHTTEDELTDFQLDEVSPLERNRTPRENDFYTALTKARLDAKYWAEIFKVDLGIETALALKFAKCEPCIILEQYVQSKNEGLCLKNLLGMIDEVTFDKHREHQKENLVQRQIELSKLNASLRTFENSGKQREDYDVHTAECDLRGILQIKEKDWVTPIASLKDANARIDLMVRQISDTISTMPSDLNDRYLLTNASNGRALKGVWLTTYPNEFSVQNSMLSVPEEVTLNHPLLRHHFQYFNFKSKGEELRFLKDFMNGNSFPTEPYARDSSVDISVDENYYSTLKCYTLPLASVSLDKDHLHLSKKALAHLKRIDEATEGSAIQKECELFFRNYGSHALTGPFHFGGVFIRKCYSSGYGLPDEKEIEKLQRDIIDAEISMYGIKCLSDETLLDTALYPVFSRYSKQLRKLTHIKVIVVGGPSNSVGFPDWKNAINSCNKTWEMIDCGKSYIPIWDIIGSIKYNHCFVNTEKLKVVMKHHWEKLSNDPMAIHTRRKEAKRVFLTLGLSRWYPQQLSIRDAIEIREDTTLQPLKPSLYPFFVLQKIMASDHRCRMGFPINQIDENYESTSDSEDEDETESDESEVETECEGSNFNKPLNSHASKQDFTRIHPMDGLLALLHCCDNFLRQDIFCRLAACQLAVPLLLPHPETKDPTLLLWAMRSIVKEFTMANKKPYSGPIINCQIPIVSFLRIGQHLKSKSEILNSVINASDSKHDVFVHYNSPDSTTKRAIVGGLVEVSWYLPSEEKQLFPSAVTFANLHGDASDDEYEKQINFLCDVCTAHVVLLSDVELRQDATREHTLKLLRRLSQAVGGVILIQNDDPKDVRKLIKPKHDPDKSKSSVKVSVVQCKENKNILDICEEVRKKIGRRIYDVSYHVPLEGAARKREITIDLDDADCIHGMKLAKEVHNIIYDYGKKYPEESHRNLLHLQSDKLWHKWAELNREQYRQEKRSEHYSKEQEMPQLQGEQPLMSIKDYGELQRQRMKEIRMKQYEQKINHVMSSFLTILTRVEGPVLWYFMRWLRFMLDDLSRETLPPLYGEIQKKRNLTKTHNEEAEDDQLKDLDLKLINASFGLEHLLREVSQIYEAVIEQDEDVVTPVTSPIYHDFPGAQTSHTDLERTARQLPQVAAELLYDGFPIEILDGDASHMPQNWISAVLDSLSDILKNKMPDCTDPQIFVLSVLGPQSTGKSTLLNTLFGVQFSVSAGRCTRGAFMQLVPVHKSLQTKYGMNFFLLIDTEGLRAPERERIDAFEHDNELATFVIGAANLTLITVQGEIVGEMDDILNTAVHAFLRMSQVQLKPCCRIIHQHVTATKADEKLRMGRYKTKKNLDKMTQIAARETGLERRYAQFSDVIKFNYEEDVTHFPDLWTGKPPMAQVNAAYSEQCQQLKYAILRNCGESNPIPSIQVHLEKLWKAILQEDFIFSFKNTFEIMAYRQLEQKYGEWSWNLKKKMIEWEQKAENKLKGCIVTQLSECYESFSASLPKFLWNLHAEYADVMVRFFKMKQNKIMLKWKSGTEPRLYHLCEKLQRHTERRLQELYQSRSGRAEAEVQKEKLSMCILERVQNLVLKLERGVLGDEELDDKFNNSWHCWISELTERVIIKPLRIADINMEVERSLTNLFKAQHKIVKEKIADQSTGMPLGKWGKCLQLKVKVSYIKVMRCHKGSPIPDTGQKQDSAKFLPLAQEQTQATFNAVNKYLTEKQNSEENFKPLMLSELHHIVQEHATPIAEEHFILYFTDEYMVDMTLIAFNYAIPVFEQMAETFKKRYDPIEYVENEMKPYLRKVFVNKYKEVESETTAAETLCQQLKEPIRECVMHSIKIRIGDEMRRACPWIKYKSSLTAKILLEVGKRLERDTNATFGLCNEYLTDTKASLLYWLKHFTETHCNSGDPSHISKMAKQALLDTFELVKEEAKCVTDSQEGTFHVSKWLKEFHAKVGEKINLPLARLCMLGEDQEFHNADIFMKNVEIWLQFLEKELNEEFETIKYQHIETNYAAHVDIYEEVSGCTAQCPFCKAQCELNNEKHYNIKDSDSAVKHTTQHRPQCLGNIRWVSDKRMMLSVCTSLVAGFITFRNADTNQKDHPYKKYADYYPEWDIPADVSLEASLFWKWLIGHHSGHIEKAFGYRKTKVPEEWQNLKWKKVETWLKREYNV